MKILSPKQLDWMIGLMKSKGTPFFLKKLSNGSRILDGREWNQLPARK